MDTAPPAARPRPYGGGHHAHLTHGRTAVERSLVCARTPGPDRQYE
ncbi:hypothetical protein [Streptomyces sp. NPDC087270]